MKIEKKSIRSGKLKLSKNVQITLDEDMNVPDSRPDVEKIVDSRGEVHFDEIEVSADRVRLRGIFLVQILYLSQEKEKRISYMEHEFPLDEWMNIEGAVETDYVKVQVNIEDLTVSIINSRKCGVRSVLFFQLQLSEMKSVECTTGVEEKKSVECWYESMPMTEIVMNKKDIVRVKADVCLPTGKPNIREILWSSTQMREVEVRMLEGKLSIRGELFLFILYQGEEEQERMQYFDWEIPFSNELECSDSKENLIGNIAVSLGNHNVSIKADVDGEPRDVEVEAALELDLRAYREFSIKILQDMYANNRHLNLSRKKMEFENLVFQNNAKKKVVQKISIGEDAKKLLQILNVEGSVRIEDFHRTRDGIYTEGLIFGKILYIVGDDVVPMKTADILIPFEYLVEVPASADTEMERCEIRGVLEQIGGYVVDGNEVEIRATVGIYVTGFSLKNMEMISDVTESSIEEEELSKIPSITGYVVKEGDNLWMIAKKYATTIDKIKEYNEGVKEPLEQGEKLFLLKEMR